MDLKEKLLESYKNKDYKYYNTQSCENKMQTNLQILNEAVPPYHKKYLHSLESNIQEFRLVLAEEIIDFVLKQLNINEE